MINNLFFSILNLKQNTFVEMLYNEKFNIKPGIPTLYVVFSYMFNELRWEVIVGFVDIGGIVDYHCLYFLFIVNTYHACIN